MEKVPASALESGRGAIMIRQTTKGTIDIARYKNLSTGMIWAERFGRNRAPGPAR
jgi:hypothetical protein